MRENLVDVLLKNYQLTIFVAAILGLAAAGIFGVVLALWVVSLLGLAIGVYRKNRCIWKPALIAASLIGLGILLFAIALLYSKM